MRSSDILKKSVTATMEYSDKRQEIKYIISKEITEHKRNLVQVKICIEKHFRIPLSTIDNAYIERKYIKCCSRFWLQETQFFFKELTSDNTWTVLLDIFNSLDEIQGINQIPNPLNQLEYYTILLEHYNWVNKKDERKIINQFKKECIEQIIAYSDSTRKQILFLEAFVNFLSLSKTFHSFMAEIQLEDFYRGDLPFQEFTNNIMKLDVDKYGKNLKVLQEVTKSLEVDEKIFFRDKFKAAISAYIKPVKIQERIIDDRLIVEVTGKNIVISEVILELENILFKNSNIEEARFVGTDIIHIDKNFINKVWQGKNVVILTKVIQVHDKVTWDVSGKHNDHTYSGNAGTGSDGHGLQGADGYPGESGGNVLIQAEEIANPENFTIISNGGKGSKGQDGGDGFDGKDGKGIRRTEFNEKFPPAANLFRYKVVDNILKTLTNIKCDLQAIISEWYEEHIITDFRYNVIFSKMNTENVIEKVINDISDKGSRDWVARIYINAITDQGNEIIFSHQNGAMLHDCQAYLLYKGSLGQSGGHGGEYGLGGQGGYGGEITIKPPERSKAYNIINEAKNGEEGEKAQGGFYGNHGKNGWDMGYMDYCVSNIFTEKWPKFFGANEDSKVELKYYSNSSPYRLRCPYKENRGEKDIYAELKPSKIEHNKVTKYEERKTNRQNNERKQHAQATRKKNISQSSILAYYSHHFTSIEQNFIQKLRLDLESSKQQALHLITEIQEHHEKQSPELRVKRYAPYENKSKSYNGMLITLSCINYKEINVKRFIDQLKSNTFLIKNWLQIKKIELNLSQLRQLFLHFDSLGFSFADRTSLFLLDKYRLAILQEIAKQLPPYQPVKVSIKLMPEREVKYLIQVKESDNDVSHPVLGTLGQYFYGNGKEQREKICKFLKDVLEKTKNEVLKYLIRAFILEVGELEEEYEYTKIYYNEYKEFQNEQERSTVSEKIQDELNNQPKPEYDWDKCCTDQAILKEYNDYIREKGVLSGSCRELLAYVFDITIRLYIEDQHNRLVLQDDHNSSSNQIIHMLCRDSKFVPLNVDKNYLKLEEEHKKRDSLYAHIFAEIKTFKRRCCLRRSYDRYLNNKVFLFTNYNSDDEQYINEKEDIEKIIEYFPANEKKGIKERLNKLTSQYIGRQRILHNILERFSSDGRHVSSQELYCLVNSVLTFFIEGRTISNIFSWIVAAHSQRSWIDELILLELEIYFKKQLAEKSKWRYYLSKIENKEILLLFKVKLDKHELSSSISTQCVEDTLRLLSNITNDTVDLEGLELSEWPYALKEKYWTCKLSNLLDWQESDLSIASYYFLSIENIFGASLTETLIEFLIKKKLELRSITLIDILSNFHNEKWNLNEEELNNYNSCSIAKWVQEMEKKFTANIEERKMVQLVELIKGNANTSQNVLSKLTKIMNCIVNIDRHVIAGKNVNDFTAADIKKWVTEFHINVGKGKQIYKEEMFAVIFRAIELKRIFKLRDTQKLTILALLENDRSTLAQVSTGEGKSLIVVAASIMKVLCGEKVDIITSSSVLAKRDAEGNTDIFDLFGINVSHNCSEVIQKRKEAYSGNHVIYGDLSYFQRDYLLDTFYGKNILGDRKFINLIVDEVDSMLLDKGNNMLYLSHDLAGLDKLEPIYVYIWQWINRPAVDVKEIFYAFDTKALKEAVISELYRLVKIEDIGKLGPELSKQQKNTIWERLIKAGILDDQGKLLKGNISDNDLNKVISSDFICYKERLQYLLKDCLEREKIIHVPNTLKPFIEQHLESWINSAISAFCMKTGEDYVVDVDKTCTSSDRNPNITILDRDTGTDQVNCQWDEALHQFLQLKHGCKLSLQSLKSVFISNVSYFKLYINLYGLTGTLGSQRERDLLLEIHEVDFVTIPTAKPKRFIEQKPYLCTFKDEWMKQIHEEAKNITEKENRSVLIICETINDVEILYKAFGGKDAKHIHTYTRDYEEFVQGNKELGKGQIIIASNLAGRGTDIKITEELKKAGGLHVCLTYLPSNIRVEQQALGRAARSGDQGSGRLIIMGSKGEKYSYSQIFGLKKVRDSEELLRISDIKAYYDSQIAIEESCFKAFKEQYEQLKKALDVNKVPIEVQEILLQSSLDNWAFWLDKHSKFVKKMTNKQDKMNLKNMLEKFISQIKSLIIEHDSTRWLAWVEGNPIKMIKLGKYLSQNEKHKGAHENAIKLFDEVIKKEQYFSEAAHYYKAFALLKKVKDGDVLETIKLELREVVRLLNERIKFATNAASIIGEIKKKTNKSIIQIDAYEEQQNTFANIYFMFSRSIDDIFGHTITPQSFVNFDIKEELAESLYNDLLERDILEKPMVENNIAEIKLKVVSSNFGISFKELSDYISECREKKINEKEFHKQLKKYIKLPDRKEFWKLLVHDKVLNEEVECVAINNDKLKEIDPSLSEHLIKKIDQKELENQTLELNQEQILLIPEWITQEKYKDCILRKEVFIKITGKEKYKVLKEKGVLSTNRKAQIDPSKIESISFPCYDSIDIEDFAKVNITKSEANKILAELAKQKFLEKQDTSENSAYKLNIKYDEIYQIKLDSCPVFEDAVKGLLSICFTYRIALQKMFMNLQEKNFPVCLQLITKPHKYLALELLEQKIIRPTMFTIKDKDLDKELKRIYSATMTENDIKNMLNQDKLIPKECVGELFNKLIVEKWITSESKDLYCINSPGKRQILNCHCPEGSRENVLNTYNIDKTVKKVLDNRLLLAKADTIVNIVSTLKRSKSSLECLEVPDSKLKPLTELLDQREFANVDEVHVFFLNGLDHLLQLIERKWTSRMFCNTATAVVMGISQIVIGTLIQLYTVGVMTHVGGAFINEGVNDLFFAISALCSGYFTWNDYAQHKLQSLAYTAITVGIGAYFSKSVKISNFGKKVAPPYFEIGGKKLVEMSGTELIQTAGRKLIGKEMAKRIASKTIQGLALGLASAGVDKLVENNLRALCEDIASSILSSIESEVDEHTISIVLKKVYKELGRKKTGIMLNDLSKTILSRQEKEFLPCFCKIASSVIQGIGEAVKKRSSQGNKLGSLYNISNTISEIMVWSQRVTQIKNVRIITRFFLDTLDQEIKERLKNNGAKDQDPNEEEEIEKDYENFKKEVIYQWKLLLRQKIQLIIEVHIVRPILKEGANYLVRYIGKQVQNVYQSYKESHYLERFEELKQEYNEKQKDEEQCEITTKSKKHNTEKYHENLINLMKKTKNPDLFASIVLENIPMDITCVDACTQVVNKTLKEKGVVNPGLHIIVEGDGGLRQEFFAESLEARTTIRLKLKDNHFEFCESSIPENNRSSASENNCLYEALVEALPDLQGVMTREEFRAEVANCIKQNKEIRNYIQQGWHQLPICFGAFGGKVNRKKSKRVHDCESSSFDNKKIKYEKFRYRVSDIANHLEDRLTRFFRMIGIVQRVSEHTNIPRDEIIEGGPSEFQDQNSNQGREIHAAHVVRLGKINPKIEQIDKKIYNEIVNFIGHTQNVVKFVNVWHGVGGDIDKFQSNWVNKLSSIDFSGSPATEDKSKIKEVFDNYITLLDNGIRKEGISEQGKSKLKEVKTRLFDMKIESLFEKGKKGYLGEGMDRYQSN